MTILKIMATHVALYLVTYVALDTVEDHLTSSGVVALAILGLSALLSLSVNLWALDGFARPGPRKVALAFLITALISPLSAVMWLSLYVGIVGYEA